MNNINGLAFYAGSWSWRCSIWTTNTLYAYLNAFIELGQWIHQGRQGPISCILTPHNRIFDRIPVLFLYKYVIIFTLLFNGKVE